MNTNELRKWLEEKEGKTFLKKYQKEKKDRYPSDHDYKGFFFKYAAFITTVLLSLGLLSSILIYVRTSDPFKASAVAFLIVWLVVFLRYFLWAIYHYNVNYGLTIKDWKKIEEARERFKNGEHVFPHEMQGRTFNPYRSQTFGIPRGTVRGMLAFTLLFGAIAILIASMGMDQQDLQNTLIRDQFEFFKTAFLMMMAFYFGDKSLRFLQNRWKGPQTQEGNTTFNRTSNKQETPTTPSSENNEVAEDDAIHLEDDHIFATDEGLETANNSMTDIKKQMNLFGTSSPTPDLIHISDVTDDEDEGEDGHINIKYPRTPIIDAGHGGILNGKYTTGNMKKYEFNGPGQKNFTIYEGVVNRKIALKLIEKLEAKGLPYYSLNADDPRDTPLLTRVKQANELYKTDKSCYYLSIHSNANSSVLKGKGIKARGFEIWTSKGKTKSDMVAKIAGEAYKKHFAEKYRWRGLKEANFTVLAKTHCPAILVENLFFDNYDEATFLNSDEGQEAIADCLFDAVQAIYDSYDEQDV